jgi:DNA-binding winged helix-turn-helix (wHTH) protein/tetratricopeptide (TPR) repeat protein
VAERADQKVKQIYEFGPFRVDPEKEILLRGREAVPLAPKTFQILLVLVRHSQEVVTKDDMMKTVWPDTFVEEANLTRNIFMLRKALGETPQDHRYVVTIPGRGYRFAEDVQLVPERDLNIIAASHAKLQVQVDETLDKRWIAFAAILLLAAAAGAYRLFSHRSPALTGKDTVVLADFTNSTGDPVFDGTLRQGMAVQLEQSPYLSLVSDQSIGQTLRLMGQPADAPLIPEIAREICERTGSAAVIDGSIHSLGGLYVLGLRARDCHVGNTLDEEQVQAARKEDVLNALDKIASSFRAHIGESIKTVEQHDVPLVEAATPSLDALKAYSLGWKVLASKGEEAALPFFERAVAIDPKFAMAYAALALMYGSTGSSELATENVTRAYELRDRASDKERFFITAYYFGRATGNQEKAQQICNEWARTYPNEFLPHAFLSGFVDLVLANYDGAVKEAQKAIELNKNVGPVYFMLGENSIYLNDLADAENAARMAAERKIESPIVAVLRFDVAYMKGDRTGMQREVELAQGNSDAEDLILDREGFAEASEGRLKNAQRLSHRAVALARQGDRRERAAVFETRAALWEAFFGNSNEAKRSASAALAIAGNREVKYGVAVALALSGDSAQAEKLAQDLEKSFPEDTSVRFSYLPVIRSVVALRRGEPSKAIDELQTSVPYEMGSPRCSQTGYFGSLYPVFFRGEALLAAGKGAEAANEFEKILSHRGTMIGDPIFVLTHARLARAYALSGESVKARGQYEEFFALWKDADSNIPILKRAQVEYARLH